MSDGAPKRAIDLLIERFRATRGGRKSFTDGYTGVTVYWDPWTLGEQDLVFFDMSKSEAFRPMRFARVLIVKALDEQGKAMFASADETELLAEVDPGMIKRLVEPILADLNADHGKDPNKKSDEDEPPKH